MAERLTNREMYILVGGVVGGLIAGFGIGYKVAIKRLDTKYNGLYVADAKRFEDELQKTRSSYDRARQNWEKPDLKEVVEKMGYSEEEQQAINEVEEEIEAEDVAEPHNVFAEYGSWNYDAEMEKRAMLNPDEPYIIHRDEFFNKDEEFENFDDTTITYYAGDDVLCDEQDEVLEPRDYIVGGDNLKMFGTGHGSGDPNILYIRNPRTDSDYEVIQNEAKYSEDALGFLEHSMFEPNRRRQRFDDE